MAGIPPSAYVQYNLPVPGSVTGECAQTCGV